MHTQPITCLRPVPSRAAQFAAPPYDVFDDASARAWLSSHPQSFLAIDLPEATFGPDEYPDAKDLMARARALLDERTQDGTLTSDETPCYYLYRLEQDGTSQTGIVCACAVEDYENGTILKHESTRREKLAGRIDHIRALDAQTGLIFLACPDQSLIDSACEVASGADPLYDYEEDGVRETVWRIADPQAVATVQDLLAHIEKAYIADGHHRAAAAVAVAHAAHVEHPDAGELASDYFLSILYASHELRIHAYNRVVSDRAGMTTDELIDAVRRAGCAVEPSEGPVTPEERHTIGVFSDGSWWTLTAPEPTSPDPASALDVSILQDRILDPVLGIADPTRDERISFVSGVLGTDELERLAGADGVAFSMHPTSAEELEAVADAGLLMPPKSTWFAPKPRSGLFVRQLA